MPGRHPWTAFSSATAVAGVHPTVTAPAWALSATVSVDVILNHDIVIASDATFTLHHNLAAPGNVAAEMFWVYGARADGFECHLDIDHSPRFATAVMCDPDGTVSAAVLPATCNGPLAARGWAAVWPQNQLNGSSERCDMCGQPLRVSWVAWHGPQ